MARRDLAAQIAHRLTCMRCRIGWYCGGLGEDDYEAGERIADLLPGCDNCNTPQQGEQSE